MPYTYAEERPTLFTESGVRTLMLVQDQVKQLLATAGAFRADKISVSGDSWVILAALDYLVEEGMIVKLRNESHCWAQFQVYTAPEVRT